MRRTVQGARITVGAPRSDAGGKNRFDAAKRRALRAKELLAEHGDSYGASFADVLVLVAQRLSGDLVGSARTCERLYASFEHGSRNLAWVNAASALAHCATSRIGSPRRALCDELMPLLPIASTPENLASVHVTLPRLEAAAGNAHEALRLLDYLHSAMEDGRHARLVALAVYERVRLALHLGEAELAQRIASIGALAEQNSWARPRPYEAGWERLGQAHALLLLHEHKTDACRAVLHSLIKTRRKPVASFASSDSRRCSRALDAPLEPLTERERRVLSLVAAGLRNEDIGERLHIALSTTKWHMKNIFAKLGVACRTKALVRAKQLRLID